MSMGPTETEQRIAEAFPIPPSYPANLTAPSAIDPAVADAIDAAGFPGQD